jgi:Prohead core protein serine protease
MKLICEVLDSKLSLIKEAKEDGRKNYYIEGVFLMGDQPNKNGRVYESKILAKEVARYTKELIETNRAYGELGHPAGPSINLDRVSHMIKSLQQEGSDFIGRAKITDTPMGNIAMNLLDEGANLGVSSRGMGTLKEKSGYMQVQDDFMLATAADIVADPSAHKAFVRGVMENVEWVYDIAAGTWRAAEALEETKKELKKMTISQIGESQLYFFEKYLNSLVQK